MAATTTHIIPHKTMPYSQGVNAIFIVEVVGLVLSPVCEVIRFVICPDKSSLRAPIAKPNPALGAIEPMLNIDVLFLVPYTDEISVVCLAGFLSLSPVFARLTG